MFHQLEAWRTSVRSGGGVPTAGWRTKSEYGNLSLSSQPSDIVPRICLAMAAEQRDTCEL